MHKPARERFRAAYVDGDSDEDSEGGRSTTFLRSRAPKATDPSPQASSGWVKVRIRMPLCELVCQPRVLPITARAVWAGASAGWAWAVEHCKPSRSDVAPQE